MLLRFVRFIYSMECLSKGLYTIGATNCSIIAYEKLQIMSVWASFSLLRRFPIARNNQAREHYKWLILCLTPTCPVYGQYLLTHFDPWLRMMLNDAVIDIHLHRYKRNCSVTCDLSDGWFVLRGAFLFSFHFKAGRIYKLCANHTSNSGFDRTLMPCSGYSLCAAEQRAGYQISWVNLQREAKLSVNL